MAADPSSLKHYKSHRFEIKSTQPGSQIYVSIDRFLLAIIMLKLKKEKTSAVISLSLSCLVLSLVLQNVFAMHAGKVLYSSCAGKTWRSIQDKFYKSKSSSHFPNFDASNTWQMGHNSRQGYFLGQELLLAFAAWIDLTSNADNSLISVEFEVYTEHFLLL